MIFSNKDICKQQSSTAIRETNQKIFNGKCDKSKLMKSGSQIISIYVNN